MNQNEFVKRLFDDRAPVYDEWSHGFWRAYAERIDRETVRALSRLPRSASLIDVGCGTASRLNRLLASGGFDFSPVVAMDFSPGMLREARKSLRPAIGLFQGDAASLPVRSSAFDVALMLFAVLGCLPDRGARREALAECARVLKPGGVLIVDVLSRNHEFYRARPEVFDRARTYKKERGWTWQEGDLLVEVEEGRPSLNHGFDRAELEALTRDLFPLSEWRCYDTETGLAGDERSGHFFGVLRK